MIDVKNVSDEAFRAYGRVIKGIDVKELIKTMDKTPLPDGVVYEPFCDELENLSVYEDFERSFYGDMPIQIGYCNGHNAVLNAVEYHRSSEINVAATDMILMLGKQQDIAEDFTYDTSKIEAFFVPMGTVVEMYATTLHYAPCGVDKAGFKCVVVLPQGTNMPIEKSYVTNEDKCLFATNKWLIAHKEAKIEGAFEGLIGENIKL